MRKNKILFCLDQVIWVLIALLPLIIYVISSINNTVTLSSILTELGVSVDNNVLYQGLVYLFNSITEISTFSTSSAILQYITYMAYVDLIHLVVDVLLFLPKLLIKMFQKMGVN